MWLLWSKQQVEGPRAEVGWRGLAIPAWLGEIREGSLQEVALEPRKGWSVICRKGGRTFQGRGTAGAENTLE